MMDRYQVFPPPPQSSWPLTSAMLVTRVMLSLERVLSMRMPRPSDRYTSWSSVGEGGKKTIGVRQGKARTCCSVLGVAKGSHVQVVVVAVITPATTAATTCYYC